MDAPKFLIVPNRDVIVYATMIQSCIEQIRLTARIDTQFDKKISERLENTEEYIVIAVGKRNRFNNTLQIRLDKQIQEMTIENFIKFTMVLIQK